ncbi:hypothetical protein Gotur_020205 [Gossypium turneri]
MCGIRCKFELLFLKIRWFTKFVLLEHLLKQMTNINDSLLFLYRVFGFIEINWCMKG